jgi:DNA-binding CsgD family transcriptional regulator
MADHPEHSNPGTDAGPGRQPRLAHTVVGPDIMKAKKIGTPARIKQAEARADQAEARTEQAKSRAEKAETRTEQAETRTDLAKTRTEQAESRTEQAETVVQRLVHREVIPRSEIPARPLKDISAPETPAWEVPLQRLTIRQREILQLIAEGQNTKQIGGILKVSPKTVEYHRMKLMAGLDLHDIPGLVRFALRAGLIPPGS